MMKYRLFIKVKTCLFFFVLGAFGLQLNAQSKNSELKLSSIPFPLEIQNVPVECKTIGDSVLTISAKGKTNLFNNPNGIYYVQDAPMVLFAPDSNFIFTAKVSGKLKFVYDVAALVIFQNNDLWAKLCYENSVDKIPTIVSVVTRKFSDDCNSMPINDDNAYLSISKKGNEFSFFYSKDGTHWKMIRDFRLETSDGVKIGFAVHGSRGNGFSGMFSQIKYSAMGLDDMRKQ